MITATGMDGRGRKLIILGLSDGNIERLKAGMPIRITPESHPGFRDDAVLVILHGKDEKAIIADLEARGEIDEETERIAVD